MIARLASDINSLFDLIATLRAGVAAQTDSFPSRYVCNSRFYSTKELHHSHIGTYYKVDSEVNSFQKVFLN